MRGVMADSDIRPTDESFWKAARVVILKRKETVRMRLDADLLTWFQGGVSTAIRPGSTILRAYERARV